MTREIVFDRAPDLRAILARAVLRRGGGEGDTIPDVRAVRRGIRIDLDHLVDYGRICGYPLGTTLPLTYPHLLVFPLQMAVLGGPGFPLAPVGAVHVENVIDVRRPVGIDEVLDAAVWAENLRPHRRGRQVDIVSEVSAEGRLVWREVSTYLARGADHPDAPGTHLPDLEAVDAVTGGPVWRLGEGTGRAYAAVSGDWNPIHLHALTARPLGFPTAIAHGMYTYARVVAALGPAVPDGGVTSRVWFRKPVRLPSTLRLRSVLESRRTLTLVQRARDGAQHAVVENSW